jgi:hypothetical protein
LRKARSVSSFDARRNSSSRRKSNEGGLSREQTSLYARIDDLIRYESGKKKNCSRGR